MKVSLKGLYDPKTYAGLENLVIVLCKGMRAITYQKLTEKKEELAKSLLQAKLNNTDLNEAISDIIPDARHLGIDFNEIRDSEADPQIDIAEYDRRYGDRTASLLIFDLSSSECVRRLKERLELIDDLCNAISNALHVVGVEDTLESIEADVRELIDPNDINRIDINKFNQLYSRTLGPNCAETILQNLRPYAQEARFRTIRRVVSAEEIYRTETMSPRSASPDVQELRPGTTSPRVSFYSRVGSPRLSSLSRLSFRGFTPIGGSAPNSGSTSEQSSRAESPVSINMPGRTPTPLSPRTPTTPRTPGVGAATKVTRRPSSMRLKGPN